MKHVDFIIFSGDLAFSGKKEEYEAAKTHLLAPVLAATGLTPERLFMVPGNHDLDRGKFKFLSPALLQPFESESQVQEWLTDEESRKYLLNPFAAYKEFVTEYTAQESPDYGSVKSLEINKVRISLLGINSALMAGRNKNPEGKIEDENKLVVGETQIYAPLRNMTGDDLRIAVLHHPFNWLAGFERRNIEQRLGENCHFILCGHEHDPRVQQRAGNRGDYVFIPAGASYDRRDRLNSYNFVHLDWETGEGIVYLRRGRDRRQKWLQDEDGYENGLYPFSLNSRSLSQKKTELDVTETSLKPSLPFDLPKQDFLVGREEELKKLKELLIEREGNKVVVLFGGAGHGKSALASYFAREHKTDFTDGIVGVKIADKDEKKSPEDIARNLAKSFHRKTSDLEGKSAATIMRELFANRRMLLILDNAHRGDDLRNLLPEENNFSIIITTRNNHLSGSLGIAAEALEVTPLNSFTGSGKDPAVELLGKIIGHEVVEAEPEAARKIVTLAGHLPLVITIIATIIKTEKISKRVFKLAVYADKLERKDIFKQGLKGDDESKVEKALNLDFTWDIIDAEEREKERIKSLFACLSVCAGEGFSSQTAMAVGKLDDEGEVADYLDNLCAYSLLNESGEKGERYGFHPIVRLYASKLARDLSLLEAAARRHGEYIIESVKSIKFSHRLSDLDTEEEWEPARLEGNDFDLGKEINDIVVAAEWLSKEKRTDDVFADKLNLFFEKFGYWEQANILISQFYSLAKEQKDWERAIIFSLRRAKFLSLLGNFSLAEKILNPIPKSLENIDSEEVREVYKVKRLLRLGNIRQKQRRFEEASEFLEKAVEIAGYLGDRELLRNSWTSLGILLEKQDNQDYALTIVGRSLKISKDLHDKQSMAIALHIRGRVLQQQGNLDEAKDAFQREMDMAKEIDDKPQQAIALNRLGGVLQQQGNLHEAKDAFQREVDIAKEIDDKPQQAIALNGLGGVLQQQGNLDEAKDAFQREMDMAKEIDDKPQQAIALNRLGGVLQQQGNLDEAKDAFQREMDMAKELDDKPQQAIALNRLGGVLQQQGNLDEAKDAFQREVDIAKEIDDKREQAIALNRLGGVLQKQRKWDEAKDAFQREVDIAKEIDDKREQAIALNRLGGVLQQQGNLHEAKDAFQREVDIAKEIDDKPQQAIALNGLGGVLKEQRKWDEAKDAFQREMDIAKEIDDKREQAIALNGLGGVLKEQRKWDEAKDAFQREMDIAKEIDDKREQAIALNGLGGVLQKLGNLDEAKDAFQREVDIAKEIDDKREQAIALNGLGGVLQKQRKWDEAKDAFQREVDIAKEIDDKREQAIALNGLGGVLQKQRKWDEAKDAFQQQVDIAKEIDDKPQQAIALNGLGRVLQKLGNLDEALKTSCQQIVLCQTLDNPKDWQYAKRRLKEVLTNQNKPRKLEQVVNEVLNAFLQDTESQELPHLVGILNILGEVLKEQQQLDLAQEILRRGQNIYEDNKLDNPPKLVDTLLIRGEVLSEQGKWQKAEKCLLESYTEQEAQPNRKKLATISNALVRVYGNQKGEAKLQRAFMYYNRSIALGEELNNPSHLVKTYTEMGQVLLKHGKIEQSIDQLSQGFEIAANYKKPYYLNQITTELTYLLGRLNRWEEAVNYCEQVLAIAPQNKHIRSLKDLIFNQNLLKEGRVKHIIAKNGSFYGFIIPEDGGADIYFNDKCIDTKIIPQLKVNTLVKCEVEPRKDKDKLQVRKILEYGGIERL